MSPSAFIFDRSGFDRAVHSSHSMPDKCLGQVFGMINYRYESAILGATDPLSTLMLLKLNKNQHHGTNWPASSSIIDAIEFTRTGIIREKMLNRPTRYVKFRYNWKGTTWRPTSSTAFPKTSSIMFSFRFPSVVRLHSINLVKYLQPKAKDLVAQWLAYATSQPQRPGSDSLV